MILSFMVFCCALTLVFVFDAELRLRALFARKSLPGRIAQITREAPRLFFALARTYLGFELRYEKPTETLPDRFMLVANHQSLMDIPVLFFLFGDHQVRFVSKKELGRGVPLISQVLRYQHHCLVQRHSNHVDSIKTIDRFARRVRRDGSSPVVFPEGTRSRDGIIQSFHSGGVRRIQELAPLPIVAVALDGGWKVSHLKGLITNLRGGHYAVKAVRTYEAPKDKTETTAILESARAEIAAQIDTWNLR
jgi:1-acyl-sn-glycerol-3-phosphate acyltransferase